MRKQQGQYLIEASAFHLPGNKWQPRLTMTRLPVDNFPGKSQSFPGLTPSFETSKGATRYALDLGTEMASHGSSRLTV